MALNMTKGSGYAQGLHGQGRLWKMGRIWWVQYYVHGQQVRESSKSDKKAVAAALLRSRLSEADNGSLPFQRNLSYEDMRQRLVTEREKQKDAVADAGLKHLDASFTGLKASAISEDRINAYIVARQKAGASNATINRSLAALGQMFRLSARWLRNPPRIASLKLEEPPARKGFLSRDQYLQLLAALPDYLRPIYTFGYHLGMRLGELQNLTWDRVRLAEEVICLEAEDTKSGEPRIIPYGRIPELSALMKELREKSASSLVFTRAKGQPLGSFRKAWIRACIKTGLGRMIWACPICHEKTVVTKQPWPPELPKQEAPQCCGTPCRWKYDGQIFHDLRRTGVRNLRRAGVPESVAMKISGHKTRAVFERYNIVDRHDVEQAMEKLAEFHEAEDSKRETTTARPI